MADFDKFSSDYTSTLNSKIVFSGENVEYFAECKVEYIRRYLGNNFKGRILDYGCGIGLVIKYLKKYFDQKKVQTVGYDISKESIKEASKNIKDARFTDDFEEINKKPFDAMIIANVLHHIKIEERTIFLKKVLSLLKKDSYIFIFEHNPYNPLTRFIVNSCIFDKNAELLKLNETVKLLCMAGARIAKKRYIVFFPSFFKALRFLEPIMGCVPLGAQYLCVGKLQTRE